MSKSFHHLQSYYNLRASLDERTNEIQTLHKSQMNCKKGCDSCCESINVFPIEFFAIKAEIEKHGIALPRRKYNRFRKSCMFLINGACSIYNVRPIICRTQGLPLMYQSLNGQGYEVSYCTLNFKNFDLANFTNDNTLFMPDFNSKLFLMNKTFVEDENLFKKNPTKRIPLYCL